MTKQIEELSCEIIKLRIEVEQLRGDNVQLRQENAEFHTENHQLKEDKNDLQGRIKELETNLNQNSRNSHLPPSRDPIRIKAAISRKKGGKIGGKKGHRGNTLHKVEYVHEQEKLMANRCSCGFPLKGVKQKLIDSRQVFDIPPIELMVKEYQRYECVCPKCKTVQRGEYPQTVKAPTQYGSRIQGLCSFLNNEYKIPFKKVSSLMKDLFGAIINEGTLVQINKRAYSLLEPFEKQIKALLAASRVLHLDETGIIVKLERYWMHVCSNEKYTLLKASPHRGLEAILEEGSILQNYQGTIIHDCWKPYFNLGIHKHGLCGHHIIRELKALIEQGSLWAKEFYDLYMLMYNNSTRANIQNKDTLMKKYNRILDQGKKKSPLQL